MRKIIKQLLVSTTLFRQNRFNKLIKLNAFNSLSACVLFYTLNVYISLETRSNLPAWWFSFTGTFISTACIFTVVLANKYSFKIYIALEFISVILDILFMSFYIITDNDIFLYTLFISTFILFSNQTIFNVFFNGYIQNNKFSVKKYNAKISTLNSFCAIFAGIISTAICYFCSDFLGVIGLVLFSLYFIPLGIFAKEVLK